MHRLERYSLFFLAGIAALSAVLALRMSGTIDGGDSVMHFLMSQGSWEHPELLLNHWGKPFFTLLSSPFSQFGFEGMRLFNVLVSAATAYFLFRSAVIAGFKWAWALPLLLYAMPAWFLAQLSGLTEPLFALMMVLPLWLQLKGREGWAAAVVSLLPFVRSEGVFIIALWGFFYLLTGKWKRIPLLLTGNALYAIAGLAKYSSPLWYFTENPYGNHFTNYGSGGWMHFPGKMVFLLGLPVLILFCVGLTARLGSIALPGLRASGSLLRERWLLVLGGFAVYFGAHMIFWRFGLYHSMGLQRVMVAVLPLCAWIAAEGLEFLIQRLAAFHPRVGAGTAVLFFLYVFAFPFTPNPAALHLPQDLQLAPDQKMIAVTAQWLESAGGMQGHTAFTSHPSLSWQLGLDHFEPSSRRNLVNVTNGAGAPGDLLIWDNWYAVVEAGIKKAWIEERPQHFQRRACFSGGDAKKKAEICVYEIIQPLPIPPAQK